MAKTEGLFTEKAVSQILREDLPFTPNPFKGIMKPFRLFSQVLLLLGLVMVCAAGSSKAAMQIDGSWFANSLPADRMDSTVVLPFPSRQGEGSAIIRGVSMGFYLTRKAWNSPRKDAAVHLLSYLATGDNARALGGYGRTSTSSASSLRARTCSSPPAGLRATSPGPQWSCASTKPFPDSSCSATLTAA